VPERVSDSEERNEPVLGSARPWKFFLHYCTSIRFTCRFIYVTSKPYDVGGVTLFYQSGNRKF
jgi:hypothetical protein